MTEQQERDVLLKCIEPVDKASGHAATSRRGGEMSEHTAALLMENGFSYDHIQNYNDFHPFYAQVGDYWTKIDFAVRPYLG